MFKLSVIVFFGVLNMALAEEMECYGPGSIAGAVIGTLIATLVVLAAVYYLYKKIWKPRQERHLMLENDAEKGDTYAFDNPGFKDAGLTPIGKALDKNSAKLDSGKHKWSQWSPLGAFVSTKCEKRKTADDTCIDGAEVKFVTLRSHDFTGLGFNIYGNMREGIFIKDILHRGPASESGKLNPGDKILSLRISFEHMVYEDALTILSYASPYEVEVEARSGVKSHGPAFGQGEQPRHPLYKSSSSTDLIKIGKSARSRLFHDSFDNSAVTELSSLHLSSNNTSLDRSQKTASHEVNFLSKPERNKKNQQHVTSKSLSPEQLKTQLEHNLAKKILNPNETHVNDKKVNKEPKKMEAEVQNEADKPNRFSKFGIRVLPMDTKIENVALPARSPKSAENSQNDNNINLEKKMETEGIDEVDKKKQEAPPVKKREKLNKPPEVIPKETKEIPPEQPHEIENFERQNSLNSSGIKRDKAGIPQEIPDHMLNAAVAARKNRKSTEIEKNEDNEIKSPKKQKGKAPAPPPEVAKLETKTEAEKNVHIKLNFTENLDEISPIEDDEQKIEKAEENENVNRTDDSISELKKNEKLTEEKEYCSDSDMEGDNHSSVNTIELNSSDITIHHSEGEAEMKNRKTASTGDLSKIHKTTKSNSGTLERAQSLDITDTGVPLTKKRKASKEDDELKSDSDDSFYDTSIKHKEPRLSLALDGLDTFQRNRLKKSTEWGNLEDAIMSLDKMEIDPPSDVKINFKETSSPIKFDFGAKNLEFGVPLEQINIITEDKNNTNIADAIMNDITDKIQDKDEVNIVEVKNEIWPNYESDKTEDDQKLDVKSYESVNISSYHLKMKNDDIIKEKTEEIKLDNPIEVTKLEVKNNVWPIVNDQDDLPESEKNEAIVIETTVRSDINEIITELQTPETKNEVNISTTKITQEPSFSLKAQFEEKLNEKIKITDAKEDTIETNPNLQIVNIKTQETSIFNPGKSSQNFIFAEKYASNNDSDYSFSNKLYDTNISDDIKVSRHSLGSLERPKSDVLKSVNKLKMQSLISSDQGGVSNITITENKHTYENGVENVTTNNNVSTASELYTTANDSTIDSKSDTSITQNNDIKNITITDTFYDNSLMNESPSSLTIDTSSDGPDSIKSHTLTFVTEIQVSTPTNGTANNVAEIEVTSKPESKKPEEILKKLPEMKFTTSSYETNKIPEKRLSQIELLRSNFEKSPPKNKATEASPSKSRIPVAMPKVDVKTSPDRKDIRNDQDVSDNERENFEVMAHSTPLTSNQRYQNKNNAKNVTVTSIRTSSKIPSGSHISNFSNKLAVPNKPADHQETDARNGNSDSFKQWVFNPGETSITSIVVDNKEHHK